jgi:anthranilate phosphoribosyltransferase
MAPKTPGAGEVRNLRACLKALVDASEPDGHMLKCAFEEILCGNASDAQIASLLMGLKMHGETPAMLSALSTAVLEAAV